jgi:16S rRNA (adenine1518-N6/adenine1519-N6)-dimethyltransferase
LVEQLGDLNIEEVIEIGPGAGILTQVLLSEGITVTAVERDTDLIEPLEEMARSQAKPQQMKVVNQDILKFDWRAWLRERHTRKGVCGNIPYHISTPILTQVFDILPQIHGSLLMVQLEFAERLVAAPNTKNYGSLSVYGQLRSNIRLAFKVPRACFKPVPKVDSAVVVITPPSVKYSEEILQKVELLTRKAFSQRRKMLSNSLAPFIEKVRDKESIGMDFSRRCETLSPTEYVVLAEKLFA